MLKTELVPIVDVSQYLVVCPALLQTISIFTTLRPVGPPRLVQGVVHRPRHRLELLDGCRECLRQARGSPKPA